MGEYRPQRIDEVFAAVEQLGGADGVTAAMRMGVENGRQGHVGLQRPGQNAPHFNVAQAQAQGFHGIAAVLDDVGGDQRHRRLLQPDQLDQAVAGDCHAAYRSQPEGRG